jgi:hypothetical protein
LSSAEDIAVAGLFGLLITHPLAGGAVILAGVVFCAWLTPRAFRAAKTTAWLFWQRLTRRAGSLARVELPRQLTADHDMLVGDAIGHDATVAWAVEAISSRPRRIPGLQSNRFGLLVATQESPGTIVFLAKKLFRHSAVPVRLDGCHVTSESAFLSENLVIYHKRYRRRAVFRFANAEAAIVARLVEDLRARIDAPLPPPPWPAPPEPTLLTAHAA